MWQHDPCNESQPKSTENIAYCYQPAPTLVEQPQAHQHCISCPHTQQTKGHTYTLSEKYETCQRLKVHQELLATNGGHVPVVFLVADSTSW